MVCEAPEIIHHHHRYQLHMFLIVSVYIYIIYITLLLCLHLLSHIHSTLKQFQSISILHPSYLAFEAAAEAADPRRLMADFYRPGVPVLASVLTILEPCMLQVSCWLRVNS